MSILAVLMSMGHLFGKNQLKELTWATGAQLVGMQFMAWVHAAMTSM